MFAENFMNIFKFDFSFLIEWEQQQKNRSRIQAKNIEYRKKQIGLKQIRLKDNLKDIG